jgi:hypothetical protein
MIELCIYIVFAFVCSVFGYLVGRGSRVVHTKELMVDLSGGITFNALLAIDVERAKRWHNKHGLEEWSALEWAGAMAGEAGEACNWAKKLKRLDLDIPSINEGDRHASDVAAVREMFVKEIADTVIYGMLAAARVGVTDFESVLRDVFNKKSEEYGFLERL